MFGDNINKIYFMSYFCGQFSYNSKVFKRKYWKIDIEIYKDKNLGSNQF